MANERRLLPGQQQHWDRDQLELLAEARACDDPGERATILAQLREADRIMTKQDAAAEQLAQLPEVWRLIYGDGPGFLSLFSGIRGPAELEQPRAAYFA